MQRLYRLPLQGRVVTRGSAVPVRAFANAAPRPGTPSTKRPRFPQSPINLNSCAPQAKLDKVLFSDAPPPPAPKIAEEAKPAVFDAEAYKFFLPENPRLWTANVKTPNGPKGKAIEIAVFPEELHFHLPSEHTIDEARYTMEMHIKHSTKGAYPAVFTLIFQTQRHGASGAGDDFISKIVASLKNGKEKDDVVNVHLDDKVFTSLRSLRDAVIPGLGTDLAILRYNGSLTTKKGANDDALVFWMVPSKVVSLSSGQYNELLSAFIKYRPKGKCCYSEPRDSLPASDRLKSPEVFWTTNAHGRWQVTKQHIVSRLLHDNFKP